MPKEKKGTDDKRKDFTAPSRSINKCSAEFPNARQETRQETRNGKKSVACLEFHSKQPKIHSSH